MLLTNNVYVMCWKSASYLEWWNFAVHDCRNKTLLRHLLLFVVSEMKIQLQLKVHLTQGFFHLQNIGTPELMPEQNGEQGCGQTHSVECKFTTMLNSVCGQILEMKFCCHFTFW